MLWFSTKICLALKSMKNSSQVKAVRRREMIEAVECLTKEGMQTREACETVGVTQSQFYKWRARHRQDSFQGLYDRSRRSAAHPRNISETERDRIIALALGFPGEGCNRLQSRLKQEGINRSATAIQNVLLSAELSDRESRYARKLGLEEDWETKESALPSEMSRTAIHRQKQNAMQNAIRSAKLAGDMVFQSFYRVGNGVCSDRIFLHFAIDAATNWSWARLQLTDNYDSQLRSRRGQPSVKDVTNFLEDSVLPTFRRKRIRIKRIFTDNRPAFIAPVLLQSHQVFEGARPLSYSDLLNRRRIHQEIFDAKGWRANFQTAAFRYQLRKDVLTKDVLLWFLDNGYGSYISSNFDGTDFPSGIEGLQTLLDDWIKNRNEGFGLRLK